MRIILNQSVRWEKIKKKAVFQCRRCQRLEHSSNNYHLNFRCVKCGKDHGPIAEGGKCEVEKDSPKEVLKCINFGNLGHTASYYGCPYLSMAQDLKVKSLEMRRTMKRNKINRLSNKVNPEVSFADITNNARPAFPPLLRDRYNTPERDGPYTHRPPNHTNNMFPNENNNSNDKPSFNFIEDMLVQFKNSLMNSLKDQFAEINKKIKENSRNIEFLFSSFED